MKYLDLSVCVVLYRSEDETRRFHAALLQSLMGHDGWELLYYDNSPTNALRDLAPHGSTSSNVSYAHDPRNLGFSYANNQLILTSKKRRLLLLNPDVFGFTPEHWNLVNDLDTSDCVRFARLLNADGTFQDCVGETSSLRRALQPRIDYSALKDPVPVGMGIMAFMLADRSVFAEVGLLDCAYPLYAEDMDWCLRARQRGKQVIYDPRIVLTHVGGASASNRWDRRGSLARKYLAERIFIDRHMRGANWLAMRALNALKRGLTHLA